MYGSRASTQGKSSRGRETYISEEEEDGSDSYANSYDEAEFEMLPSRTEQPRRASTRRSGPAMKKIRVKVHADDTRYVLVGTAVEFPDFVDQVRAKFGLRQAFKIKIKDDGDMITMADQEDLDMAIEAAKSGAKREKSDMGKMEVSLAASFDILLNFTNVAIRSGYKLSDGFDPLWPLSLHSPFLLLNVLIPPLHQSLAPRMHDYPLHFMDREEHYFLGFWHWRERSLAWELDNALLNL